MAVVEEFFQSIRPDAALTDAEKAIVNEGFRRVTSAEAMA